MSLSWYLWVALALCVGLALHDLTVFVVNARRGHVETSTSIAISVWVTCAVAIALHGVSP